MSKVDSKKQEDQKSVSSEMALKELKNFLKKHKSKEFRRGQLTDDKIREDYVDVLEAIEDGLLVFDDKLHPTYTLEHPLYENSDNPDLVVKQVNFRSRVKAADKTLIMDGLDFEKQRGTYVVKLLSYITKLSITDIKQLENEDFVILNQLCSVF
ncbi:hypothetical protein [Christiangramia sp.]|uniref:hypothetical protein n=1 Tax=Christiangramia sp. TaxID=1931228 RepID=UPI002602E33E|nr:hypothetical protein [Christiangramia sp.]